MMGRAGFLYDSMKDQLKWHHLDVKHYITIISKIGTFVSLDDAEFKKEKVKRVKVETAISLKAVFGDGK